MVKILPASCQGGVVTVEGQVVEAEILSQGVLPSTGILILDGSTARYLTTATLDLRDLILMLDLILQQVIVIGTAIDAVTNSPGSGAAGLAALNILKTQLNLTKDNLR